MTSLSLIAMSDMAVLYLPEDLKVYVRCPACSWSGRRQAERWDEEFCHQCGAEVAIDRHRIPPKGPQHAAERARRNATSRSRREA